MHLVCRKYTEGPLYSIYHRCILDFFNLRPDDGVSTTQMNRREWEGRRAEGEGGRGKGEGAGGGGGGKKKTNF